ncbi:hypothetical protein BS78_01G301800 [Paspalum vaginatum]|nr:hypothetical protein BS78_01G301800 [Paspalum vaginatum]
MDKNKKSGRGYVAWNDDMDKVLLDTFVEHYNKGDKCQNGWKSHKKNISSRNKTFDKYCTIINGMLGCSGFGWDSEKNRISVDSDAVWEAYVEAIYLMCVDKLEKLDLNMRYKTILFWDSINLVYGKDHATGAAARTAAKSSMEMCREENSMKEPSSSSTSASLKRQRSAYKFTEALKEEPKGSSSKEILATLGQIEGLDEDTELELYDILTADERKYESLLALPMERRRRWLLKQLKK